MKLSEIASACLAYSRAGYDESYRRFRNRTGGRPALDVADHRKALLEWLNKWGCRQFAINSHHCASEEVASWYKQYKARLFPVDRSLLDLTGPELELTGLAFESLSHRTACFRERNANRHAVRFGPTGAAKVLFAIRPCALPPWDGAIRRRLGHDGSKQSYLSYLSNTKSRLIALEGDCRKAGFELADLPQHVNRPDSTVAKIIDEYNWVKSRES